MLLDANMQIKEKFHRDERLLQIHDAITTSFTQIKKKVLFVKHEGLYIVVYHGLVRVQRPPRLG